VIGGTPERRLRCNHAGMRQLLPDALRHGLVLRSAGRPLVGALIATPPNAYPLPAPSLWAQLHTLFVQGPGVRLRWGRVFEHLDRLHPMEPHWYLATLGVAPDARGRGVGRALLATLLERADRDALPCYLETDVAANLGFYEPAGFRVEQESQVIGARVWHMRRPPAPGDRGAGTGGTN